jgi:hypothetical protein
VTWRSLVLALSSAAALADAPVSAISADSAPGLRLAIRAEPRETKVGDEVILDLALTNVGTRSYENGSLGEDDCAFGFDLTVTGPDGQEVPEPDARGGIVGSCLGGLEELLPGATAHGRISLNRRTGFLRQGEYRVSAFYRPWGRSASAPSSTIEWPRVISHEVFVVVGPRSSAEMGRYIASLGAQLAALRPGEADAQARYRLVRRLGYTGDSRIIPAVVDAMYAQPGPGGGGGARDALVRSLADKKDLVRAALLEAARTRGLANGEMAVILWMLGTPGGDVDSLIERALDPNSPATWETGVDAMAVSDDPDRFTARLVAIARDRTSPAREASLSALARNRSDEGVKVLHEALADPDTTVRDTTAAVIRSSYISRRHPDDSGPGRPLLPSDFDEALQAAPAPDPGASELRSEH